MMMYEIRLGHSVGDITFGMPRKEARQILGEYREFKSSVVNVNTFDQFSFCHLGYDMNNRVEFICVHLHGDIALSLNNKTISNMTALELFSFIKNLDSTVELEENGVGFESNALGFAAYFEKTPASVLNTEEEIVVDKLETITIAVQGYWNKYSA